MTLQQNKDILEAVFAETARGDGRAFVDTLAENVRWTIIGSTPWSKTYAGKGSVLAELLRPLGRQLGGPSVIKASKFIADGDHVVVQATGHNSTVSGDKYENSYCWVIRMQHGKMVELTEYADTQLIAAALRAPDLAG